MIWAAIVLGLGLAAFGAAAGAALISLSRAELTRLVAGRLRGGAPQVDSLARIEYDLTAASATTSLGVLLVGAAVPGILAGAGVLDVAVALLAAPVVLFVAYLVPRWLAQPRAEAVADRIVPVLRPWSKVLGILLPVRTPARATDLRAVWREGAAAGLRADDELVLAGGVMAFTSRAVREVMTPRTDVVAIPENAPLEEIRAVFAQSGYSRIPVVRGTLDDIVGMLHVFDLFKFRPNDPLPVRPVALTPASRSCGDLLLDMQRERRHLAVVLDEFGGTLGIATLEDLLEELVGEIFDEHDPEAPRPPAAETTVLEADGNVTVKAVEERFQVALPPGRPATLGGRLAEWVGRIPNAGERFVVGGLEIDVLQASPTRVERLVVRAGPHPPVVLQPQAT